MANTRFYFPIEGSGTPNISPSFDAGWNQTGQANRLKLLYKKGLSTLSTLTDSSSRTVPITTTQNILCNQFISDPIPPQNITGTVSVCIRCDESSVSANVFLAVVIKIISSDGGTVRGTLFSNFSNGAEMTSSATTSASTKIVNTQAITTVISQPGDRILVEMGGQAQAPTAATTYLMRFGNSAASDFALTEGLTTDLNPWLEFSQDMFNVDNNNYKSVKVGNGMSVGEKIR